MTLVRPQKRHNMAWNDTYTSPPAIWLSLATAVFLILLAHYSWRRRSVPGALPFAIGSLFAALWIIGIALEMVSRETAVSSFWLQFQRFWLFPATLAITGFILDYIWPGRWLTHRNILLFALIPFIIYLISFWYPLLGNLIFAYSYALSFIVMLSLLWLFFHTPQPHWPAAVMLIGQIGARLAYALNFAQLLNTDLPINVLAIAFVFFMYAVALFGFHIFDPDTLGRQSAIDQMPSGMVVLNNHGQITNLNPAARHLLGAEAIGQPLHALPSFASLDLHARNDSPLEIHLERPPEKRVCWLTITPLQDWRGLAMGTLLLLQDVTEQKRAQAQIITQQRALATLQERERLARELHDSLGQALAATHLQASAARQLLAQGRLDHADQCLVQMAEISLSAEADVRDYLLGAKIAFSAETTFLDTLRHYTGRFAQQYNLQITVATPPELDGTTLGFPVEVQLLRIIQEALSNIRKHAAAHTVEIRFTATETGAQVTITDDGCGFDPTLTSQTNGFGLQAMRERATTLGGTLNIHSQPGTGTQITAHIPLPTAH